MAHLVIPCTETSSVFSAPHNSDNHKVVVGDIHYCYYYIHYYDIHYYYSLFIVNPTTVFAVLYDAYKSMGFHPAEATSADMEWIDKFRGLFVVFYVK